MASDFRLRQGRPDENTEIPNNPFGQIAPTNTEVLVQTASGNLTIPGAVIDENTLRVIAREFLVGGLDLGTF
jgi:hypothetical protein